MPASTWLRQVLHALREDGIPEHRQRQFLEELQDHLTDWQEANMNEHDSLDLEQTMGSPEQLAQALAKSYRSERFLARHPWLAYAAFALGPLVLYWVLTVFLSFMAMAVFLCVTQATKGVLPESFEQSMSIVMGVISAATCVGVTAWFCLAARRNRLSWRMSLLSCATLAMGTILLFDEMCESQTALWAGAIVTCLASLATWYAVAWRGQRWKREPISLSRSYPFLLSGLGSLTVAALCLGGYLVLVGIFISALSQVSGLPRIGEHLRPLAVSCRFVPFAAAAYLCWRMTSRCPRQLLYSLAACLCVAFVATLFFADLSPSPEGEASFQFGVGVALKLGWSVLAQFLTPLAIWGLLTLTSRPALRWRVA